MVGILIVYGGMALKICDPCCNDISVKQDDSDYVAHDDTDTPPTSSATPTTSLDDHGPSYIPPKSDPYLQPDKSVELATLPSKEEESRGGERGGEGREQSEASDYHPPIGYQPPAGYQPSSSQQYPSY